MMNGGMMIGMGLVALVLLAVLVLAVVGVVWLVRRLWSEPLWGGSLWSGPEPQVDGGDAREILRRRYAAGEIDEAELDRRMAVLDR